MRIELLGSLVIVSLSIACASIPVAGPLDNAAALHPRIIAVDTSHPPKSASVDLDQAGYVAVVLVAPGHSATVVYPIDSNADNSLDRGAHQLAFRIPDVLVLVDTMRGADRIIRRGPAVDTTRRNPGRQPTDTSARGRTMRLNPLSPTTPTYLLLLTSPKPLVYQRLIDKTAGVTIPTEELEALSAVAKAIKSTIPTEPRDLAGYYQRVELRRRS